MLEYEISSEEAASLEQRGLLNKLIMSLSFKSKGSTNYSPDCRIKVEPMEYVFVTLIKC